LEADLEGDGSGFFKLPIPFFGGVFPMLGPEPLGSLWGYGGNFLRAWVFKHAPVEAKGDRLQLPAV